MFRRQWNLKAVPAQAVAAISCDNSYVLYVNGQRVHRGENWEVPDSVLLTPRLKAGPNQIVIVATNGGTTPNPAGLFFEARLSDAGGAGEALASDETWQWTKTTPDKNGRFQADPGDWQPAVPVAAPEVWASRLNAELAAMLAQGEAAAGHLHVGPGGRQGLGRQGGLQGGAGLPSTLRSVRSDARFGSWFQDRWQAHPRS